MRRAAVLGIFGLFLSCISQAAELNPPSTAEMCGRCHRSIFEAWKSSAHAQAMESRIFQDALELAETDFGATGRKTCLKCHSPVGVASGDWNLEKKISWEGVTCDYCHSVRQVSLTGANPKALVTFTLVKSGPLKDSNSMAHGTEYSDVHTTSMICAPCHDYQNSQGLSVLTTFSEWKNSRYGKEGTQCQSCHMSKVAGEVVDPHIRRSELAKINLHQMPGSHSLEQLTKTVALVLNNSRKNGQLQVSVQISNKGAGHYVPTGSPLRQLILEVRAETPDGNVFKEERIYKRTVADSQGKLINLESMAFLKGAKVLKDTRLAPDEKRTESFTFPIRDGVQVRVMATLKYYYSPMARVETQKQVTFMTMTRLVP
ncbi:MAG: multiheme c-type cytochrome [Terriglobia bacterium]